MAARLGSSPRYQYVWRLAVAVAASCACATVLAVSDAQASDTHVNWGGVTVKFDRSETRAIVTGDADMASLLVDAVGAYYNVGDLTTGWLGDQLTSMANQAGNDGSCIGVFVPWLSPDTPTVFNYTGDPCY